MKTRDYAAFYLLNLHFDALDSGIDQLQAAGLLSASSAEARKITLIEVRARLNAAVSRAIEASETDDLCRFEDLRLAALRKEAAEQSRA